MIKKIKIIFLLCFFLIVSIKAENDSEIDPYVEKGFLIILSTKNYESAKKFAEKASKELGIKLDLRDLSPNEEIGLTFPRSICEEQLGSFPCYTARGRWDDGKYISIEYSDVYCNFTPGYYMVVAASDQKKSQLLKPTLLEIRKIYEDAYIRYDKVYMGCVH